MQNENWVSVLSGVATIGAGLFLIWLGYHLLRLLFKSVVALCQGTKLLWQRSIQLVVNAFSGSWQPSFLIPLLARHEPIEVHAAPPTHLIYLALLIAGLFEAASTLLDTVPKIVIGATSTNLNLFALPMVAFCAATCVHQYLIYRDLTSAEEISSDFAQLYAKWWIGSMWEYLLRVLILLCLLISSGELTQALSRIPLIPHMMQAHTPLVVALGNIAMFCAFLLWNSCAIRRSHSRLSAGDYQNIRNRIIPAAVAEVMAVILWAAVALLIARPAIAPVAANIVTLTGTLYAGCVVWRYGPANTLQLCVAASCIVLLSVLLGFTALKGFF